MKNYNPVKYYPTISADIDKRQILSDNQGKSGIYLFRNLVNEKQYIGSALDLRKRLSFYYSNSALEVAVTRGRS